MNLDELKSRQLKEASVFRLYGHEIDVKSSAKGARRGWRAFQPCFCVHDSPDSPCPCMHDMIWWVAEGSIIGGGSAKHRDRAGKSLDYIEVSLGADVLIETVTTVSARDLKELGVVSSATWGAIKRGAIRSLVERQGQ